MKRTRTHTLLLASRTRPALVGFLLLGLSASLFAEQGDGNREEAKAGPDATPYKIPEAILQQTTPIFDGKTLEGWVQVPADSWAVKDGTMASKGLGRGMIYTTKDYTKYRLFFLVRQVKGNHSPGILFFGTRPAEGAEALDSLGALQFQVFGAHWDYRPIQNKKKWNGHTGPRPKFDKNGWIQVEMLVDATTGIARMAVAQPPGSKAVEILKFSEPGAGKAGPIAWQMHNPGLFDEYKDVRVEVDPKEFEFITTK